MKNVLLITLVLSATFSFFSCQKVKSKEVVVRVDDLGQNAGQITILNKPGKYGLCMAGCTDYTFPTTEQNYRWTEDEQAAYGSAADEAVLIQIEGNDCKLDVGIRFNVDRNDTTGLKKLVETYPTDLEGIVDGLMYEMVRSAIKEVIYGLDLTTVQKDISKLMRDDVTGLVKKDAKEYAIIIHEIYDISGLKAPKAVMEKKQATQEADEAIQTAKKIREKMEIENRTKIDAAKADSIVEIIKANAQAEATRILNENAPSNNVLRQKELDKWNGTRAIDGSNILIESKNN